jgi:glutamyl-tRNA reductase
VASRRSERAAAVADRWGCRAAPLADLPAALAAADVDHTATAAPPYLLGRATVAEALSHGRTRQLVLIDLSVPRNVDPDVLDLGGVNTYDLDAIQAEMHDALAERRRAEPLVEAIIREEVDRYAERLRQAALAPVIADLRRQAESIRRQSIEQTLERLPDLDAEARRQVLHLSHTLVNRLLHHPTLHLRHNIPQQEAEEYSALVRSLFSLPGDTP